MKSDAHSIKDKFARFTEAPPPLEDGDPGWSELDDIELPQNLDANDIFLRDGPQAIIEAVSQAKPVERGERLADFLAYMPGHRYIFMPSGEMWPASSVNSRIAPIPLRGKRGE